MLETYLPLLISVVVSVLWMALWVRTYKPLTVKRFLIRTLVFILLSLLVAYVAARIIFLPVDDTYSASNIGALGLLCLMFLGCFGLSCISAFGITLGMLIDSKKNLKQENEADDESTDL